MASVISTIRGLFRGNGIVSRSARGSLWLLTGSTAQESLRLLRNILLTRILAPADFGAMAIVMAFTQLFESVTEVGIGEAVVQDVEGARPTYLNAAWIVSAARGIAMWAAGMALAGPIAAFYRQPELLSMLRIAFTYLLLRGLMSIRTYVALKRMRMQTYVGIMNGAGIMSLVLTIVLGYQLRTGMALAYGLALEGAFTLVLSYVLSPYLPRLEFKKEHTRSLMSFVKGYAGMPILTFLFLRADVFVIGRVLTPEETGLYAMAAALGSGFAVLVSKVVLPIFIPVFSEIKSDRQRVEKAITNLNAIIPLVAFPVVALSIVFGGDILSVVYTDEYRDVGVCLAILVYVNVMRIANMPVASVYVAFGKPEYQRLYVLVRVMIVAATIYPLVATAGLLGGAISLALATTVAHVVQSVTLRRVLDVSTVRYLSAYLVGACVSVPVLLLGLLRGSVWERSVEIRLISGGIVLFAVYLVCVLLGRRLWSRIVATENKRG